MTTEDTSETITGEVFTGPITVEYRTPYSVIILPDDTKLLKVHPRMGLGIAQALISVYTEARLDGNA